MAVLARRWNILPSLGLPATFPVADRLPPCLTASSVAAIEAADEPEDESAADGLEEYYSLEGSTDVE